MAALPSPSSSPDHDPYAALRLRDFRLLLFGGLASSTGMVMQTTALAWDLYERTNNPFALAMVGLVQIVPVIALALPAGYLADHVDRRKIILFGQSVLVAGATGMAIASHYEAPIYVMYLCLLVCAIARAFLQPARTAFMTQIVPREKFSNAVTWSSAGWQTASIAGPALAGLIIGFTHRATPVYFIDAAAVFMFLIAVSLIKPRPHVAPAQSAPDASSTLLDKIHSLLAGIRFVWSNKVILAAISLDMFAVLLGGAVALIPVYASDVLHVGPREQGWMRSAPAIGALVMGMFMAHRPPLRRAGNALLWSVAGFGAATIFFGLSRNLVLSLVMLFLTGALDSISVIVRHTLLQVLTPDAMRGRVSAVNGLFIGISNELGDVESGAVTGFLKPRFGIETAAALTVVGGGIGTMLVVAIVALLCPQLRKVGRLDGLLGERK